MKLCRCVPSSLRANIPNGTMARWHVAKLYFIVNRLGYYFK